MKRLIRTKVLAKRDVGPADVNIDVPEVVETRLNRTVENWTLGQTLVISAGITPGILQSKTGFMNLRVPGTVPTDTELLVFIDIEPERKSTRSTKRRDSSASQNSLDDERPSQSSKQRNLPADDNPFGDDETLPEEADPATDQVTRRRTSRDDF